MNRKLTKTRTIVMNVINARKPVQVQHGAYNNHSNLFKCINADVVV